MRDQPGSAATGSGVQDYLPFDPTHLDIQLHKQCSLAVSAIRYITPDGLRTLRADILARLPEDLYAPIPLADYPAPALPSLSPQVFQAAFIHSSKNVNVPRSKFSFSEDFVDNERLEFLGDALL